MAFQGFILRIMTERGNFLIEDLTEGSTFSELKARVSNFLQVPSDLFRIMCGYPPRPLEGRDASTLQELGIPSGQVLHVRRIDLPRPTLNQVHVMPAMPVLDAVGGGDVPAAYDRYLQTSVAGIMMRKPVPSNNSCLFTSVHVLLSNGAMRPDEISDLRRIIARTVASDQEKYNAAVLGMSNADYCTWIQNPENWGGAIELAILSEHFRIEIDAIDISSLTLHRFGEANNYINRIFVIYDGIHYDPLAVEIGEHNLQTIFPVSDELVVRMAMEVAQEARASRQFTNVAQFTLRCLVCGQLVNGDVEARAHALSSRHVNFGEIPQ